ncbi:MAG: hypothetical protein MHM6MM_006400 [Cercozoa sp. M6MM]
MWWWRRIDHESGVKAIEENNHRSLQACRRWTHEEWQKHGMLEGVRSTVLGLVCALGRVTCLRVLLDVCPPEALQMRDFRGRTPLLAAVFKQQHDCVRTLLQHERIDLEMLSISDGFRCNVFHHAASNGDLETFGLLKNYCKDGSEWTQLLEQPNAQGMTPLLASLFMSDPTTCHSFVRARGHVIADVNSQDCLTQLRSVFPKEAVQARLHILLRNGTLSSLRLCLRLHVDLLDSLFDERSSWRPGFASATPLNALMSRFNDKKEENVEFLRHALFHAASRAAPEQVRTLTRVLRACIRGQLPATPVPVLCDVLLRYDQPCAQALTCNGMHFKNEYDRSLTALTALLQHPVSGSLVEQTEVVHEFLFGCPKLSCLDIVYFW